MGSFIDLTGKRFGRLLVTKLITKEKDFIWECKCDCGNIKQIKGSLLRSNRVNSCGCLKQESDRKPKNNVKDLVGQKFNFLTVVQREGSDNRGEALWKCKCDCGNFVTVLGSNLRSGHTQSCGCMRISHGELKIYKLLCANKIAFVYEYKAFKFPETNKFAKFDFFVDKKYMIEYDGETHFQYNMHGWHNRENYNNTIERDKIKTQWCIDNNIPLIRIPYQHLEQLSIEDLLVFENNEFLCNYTGVDYLLNSIQKNENDDANWEPVYKEAQLIEYYDVFGNFVKAYHNYAEIKEELNIEPYSVYQNLIGQSKQTDIGQFKLKGSNKIIKDVSTISQKPIIQKNINGEILNVFQNVKEAQIYLNKLDLKWFSSNILRACKGKRHTYLGYKWEFVES